MTSTSAELPWPHYAAYAAASAGAEQAARNPAPELEGSGIRVNLLRCGNVKETDFATKDIAPSR